MICGSFMIFDGSVQLHRGEPVSEGIRFSLVWFSPSPRCRAWRTTRHIIQGWESGAASIYYISSCMYISIYIYIYIWLVNIYIYMCMHRCGFDGTCPCLTPTPMGAIPPSPAGWIRPAPSHSNVARPMWPSQAGQFS